MRKAVCLLSGGIDSAVAAAIGRSEGFSLYALTIRYGQRHARELESAVQVACSLRAIEHRMVDLDLRALGGSALTDDAIAVPKGRVQDELAAAIPVTYVPARNTIFLAIALGWAEVLGARDIFFGANVLDYSGYPDCRPAFIRAFEQLAGVATKAGVSGGRFVVHAPLLHSSKAQIIRQAADLGVDLSLTWSCYDPAASGLACGACDSCQIRRRAFVEAGLPDVTRYVS